ncbi:receptor-like protein 19 [Lycium barbarum]|uniref:receptor-like protein 19 n=1 Tax=Lycium barbarum TaxID=112863 RepID=UPI00293F35A5|nr:receptor-like protein 19 [Lycium barbarum]
MWSLMFKARKPKCNIIVQVKLLRFNLFLNTENYACLLGHENNYIKSLEANMVITNAGVTLIYPTTTSVTVPNCLGNIELSVLDLRRNNFSGSLPRLCAQSPSYLKTIILNGNQFEGPILVSLLNCTRLEVLDMGNNAKNDMFLAWLGALPELQVLILRGSLPAKVFENFRAMIKLYGTDKGEIKYMEESVSTFGVYEDSVRLVIKGQEIELQRIGTIMTTIDLSSNHFEGVIPKTIKDLRSLGLLNLSHNNLSAGIPMELGKLNMLEALDLSWNRLTGKIPQEFDRMNFLAVLNLSQNLLVRPIPQGSQFDTFSSDSYGGNLDVCGPPLSKKCGTSDPSESEEEDESSFLSGFTWESVVIGYSCGLVVGTITWSLMFKAHKLKWLVEFFEGAFPKKMRRAQKRRRGRQT